MGGDGVVVVEGPWGQGEATEASSRAQSLAQHPKSSPLPTPPGPIKLRLFGEEKHDLFDYPFPKTYFRGN